MPTTIIHIEQSIHDELRRLAEENKETIEAILAKAIEDYRRKSFMTKANQAYAILRQNKDLWQEELNERKDWDATLEDGQNEE